LITFGQNEHGQCGVNPEHSNIMMGNDFPMVSNSESPNEFIKKHPSPLHFFHKLNIKDVACGAAHTIVLLANKELYSFGLNSNG
jgi:hypothetical protein